MGALRKVTKSKLDLMRKYNVSTADMAQVLEIDEAILLSGDREKTLGVSGGGKLDFNHCFEFLVETASLAKLTLEFKKRPVASTSEEVLRGDCAADWFEHLPEVPGTFLVVGSSSRFSCSRLSRREIMIGCRARRR